MIAIVYALLSLVFAAMLDIIFKRYSARDRSRGLFVAGMGLMWGALQFALVAYVGTSLDWSQLTILYGLAGGLAVTASNILLIESLTHINVSVGSTIYRLNTIGVVVLSYFFLQETIDPLKFIAIAFGIAAAITLYGGHTNGSNADKVRLFFWVAVVASALRACFGVISKAGLSAGADRQGILLIAAGCWVIGGLAYAVLREREWRVETGHIGYAGIAGIVVFLIVNTLIWALTAGDATTVIPIANLSFVGALILSVMLGLERFNLRKGIAVLLAVVCIGLMALSVSAG